MKTANNNTPTTVTPYQSTPEYTKHKATILRIANTYDRFHAGAVLAGDEARQVMNGPMVPGPWAYTFGLCITIHNGSAEMKRREKEDEESRTVIIKEDDLLEIEGTVYRVQISRREYVNLIAV
jgi:hypothetical protein